MNILITRIIVVIITTSIVALIIIFVVAIAAIIVTVILLSAIIMIINITIILTVLIMMMMVIITIAGMRDRTGKRGPAWLCPAPRRPSREVWPLQNPQALELEAWSPLRFCRILLPMWPLGPQFKMSRPCYSRLPKVGLLCFGLQAKKSTAETVMYSIDGECKPRARSRGKDCLS